MDRAVSGHRAVIRWLLLAPLVLGVAAWWPTGVGVAGQAAGDASRGEVSFQANCAMCHGTDATGMMGMHPALRGAVDRLTVEGVEVTIRNGRDTRPPMPAFGGRLDDEDIDDLVAYLETLPSGPRNFGPDSGDGPMGGDGGMGGMMSDMMGGGTALVWIVTLLVVGILAGVMGYLLGQRTDR